MKPPAETNAYARSSPTNPPVAGKLGEPPSDAQGGMNGRGRVILLLAALLLWMAWHLFTGGWSVPSSEEIPPNSALRKNAARINAPAAIASTPPRPRDNKPGSYKDFQSEVESLKAGLIASELKRHKIMYQVVRPTFSHVGIAVILPSDEEILTSRRQIDALKLQGEKSGASEEDMRKLNGLYDYIDFGQIGLTGEKVRFRILDVHMDSSNGPDSNVKGLVVGTTTAEWGMDEKGVPWKRTGNQLGVSMSPTEFKGRYEPHYTTVYIDE